MKDWKRFATLLTASVLALPATAGAVNKHVNIQCGIGLQAGVSWATLQGLESTTAGSGTANHLLTSAEFDDSSDEEIMCVWTVPLDYDSSATNTPKVDLSGWSTTDVPCISDCGTDRKVEFEVSSRPYADGEDVNLAEGPVDAAGLVFSAVGSTFESDVLQQAQAEITDDASDFNEGDLVLITIRRDTGVTNNLASPFFMPEGSVRLQYPTP